MSYLPVPPAANGTLSGTRDQIRDNFTKIQTDFAVNHIGFDLTDEGKHKFIQMPVQVAPTTNASEGTIYSNDVSGVAQLFFKGENEGSPYQLTTATDGVDPQIASFGTIAGANSSGWTFLPGGLILQYGIRSVEKVGTATTVPFPKTFATAVYSITVGNINDQGNSPSANNQFIKDGSVTTSQFLVTNSSSGTTRKIYWQAIGK